jgi:hypothetical protein
MTSLSSNFTYVSARIRNKFELIIKNYRPGCIKRCQVVVKVKIMSSDLIGEYLTFYLNRPIKWADFRLDALLADTMLTKLYTTGP